MKRFAPLAIASAFTLGACVVVNDTSPDETRSVIVASADAQSAGLDPFEQVGNVRIARDVIYGHKEGMANVYDVIQPNDASGAAVLYMVSGGWFSRWAPPEERVEQFRSLLDAGITVIPVHHGSAPRFKVPEAHADVKRALRHVSKYASAYNVDPDRIGVFGGSAGGHLSLMLGLNGDDGNPSASDPVEQGAARIKAVVAYFPPVDLRTLTGPNDRFPALDFPQDQAAAISPILFVDENDPPTLIVHGDADELVDISSGQSIHDALKVAGAETKMVIIEGGDHGFTNPDHRAEAYAEMVAFFRDQL